MVDEKDELIAELKRENRLLKVTFCECKDCKNADLYIPSYTYPFFNPRCKLTGKEIYPFSRACEDFELIGRNSR